MGFIYVFYKSEPLLVRHQGNYYLIFLV